MNKFFATVAAATFGLGLFTAAASAASISPSQQDGPFQGVTIVPASASATENSLETTGFKRGKLVEFNTRAEAGSIVIITKQNKLYYVLGNGRAVMFRVATAKKGFEWKGTHEVSAKAKWPSWTPPKEMRKRRPDLPAHAPSISAPRSTASMAPTSRLPSARPHPRAASAC